MPLVLLLALFIAVPLAELYVILKVGDAIGAPLTVLILFADSILGSLLLRSQGRSVWRRFNESTAAGRVPHREILDGALILVGGALLLTPGFLTDVVGLAFLLPPSRAWVRATVTRRLARRVAAGVADAAERRAWRGAPHYDVEGTASEHTGEPSRLER